MKVLFDSNVIVDAFSKREGSNADARSLCLLVAGDAIDGFLCSKQITDIHYVLRRYIPSEEDRMKVIKILMDSFTILPLDKNDLSKAVTLKFDDFEDAILSVVAERYGIDNIVSSNQKHFVSSKTPSLLPSECLVRCGQKV